MSIVETIDLREKPSGCKQHPLIKLKNMLEKLGDGEAIKVITDERIIPLTTLRVIAEKKNLEINVLNREGSVVEVVIAK